MIGEWVDKGPDSEVRVNCRWSEDGNFLIRSFTVKQQGKPVMTVTQRIGWDPLARRIRSWEFDSEGGFGEGTWSRDGERWVDQALGRPARGGRRLVDQRHGQGTLRPGAMVVDRPGPRRESLPGAEAYVLVRVPPAPRTPERPAGVSLLPEHDKEPADDPQHDDPDARHAWSAVRGDRPCSPTASAAAAASRRGSAAAASGAAASAAAGGSAAADGGFRGGEMGGMATAAAGLRGGYGGMSSFGRTPSFSSPGRSTGPGGDGSTGMSYGSRGRRLEGRTAGGSSPAIAPARTRRAGRDDRLRRRGARPAGPGGAAAGRGVAGVACDDGRRPELHRRRPGRRGRRAGRGRRGRAVERRRRLGPRDRRRGSRSGSRRVRRLSRAARRRGGGPVGPAPGGYHGYGATGFRPNGFNAYGAYHPAGSTATGTATATPPGAGATATGAGAAAGLGLGMGMGWGPGVLGLRVGPLRHGLHALLQPLLRLRRRRSSITVVAVPYDYSQPIDTTGAPASATVADPAMATFDAGPRVVQAGRTTTRPSRRPTTR